MSEPLKRCRECEAEYRQLAEWLKILKSAKFEYNEAWRIITHPTPDVTYADKQRAQVILDKFRNSLGAISTLQTQDVPDTNVGDMISRQAAIDIVVFECGRWAGLAKEISKQIKQLPSVQPESNWIPVSERMPEDGENCLVSVRCSNNFLVDRGTYSIDLFKVDEENFFRERSKSGWYYLSPEYGYCKILNVIAWMPEPRPYKEIKDEGFN